MNWDWACACRRSRWTRRDPPGASPKCTRSRRMAPYRWDDLCMEQRQHRLVSPRMSSTLACRRWNRSGRQQLLELCVALLPLFSFVFENSISFIIDNHSKKNKTITIFTILNQNRSNSSIDNLSSFYFSIIFSKYLLLIREYIWILKFIIFYSL